MGIQRKVFDIHKTNTKNTHIEHHDLVTAASELTIHHTSHTPYHHTHLFLGLKTGELAQYTIQTNHKEANYNNRTQLQHIRTQKVCKKDINKICTFHQDEQGTLAVLSSGQIHLVSTRDLQSTPVKNGSLKGVFSIVQDLCNLGCRNLLAICRTSLAPGLPKRLKLVFLEVNIKEDVHDLQVLHEQSLDEITSLKDAVWYGDSILMRSDTQYLQFTISTQEVREIFSAVESVSNSIIPIVEQKTALLLTEDIGTIVNMFGEPTGGLIQFPIQPLSLQTAFPYVLAVFSKAIYVYDIRRDVRDSHVQTLSLNHFLTPDVEAVPTVMVEKGDDVSVIVCHNTTVILCSQVALEDQCREMIRMEEYAECLNIASSSRSQENRDYLIENSCAESGFLLMAKCKFSESISYFERCQHFQPSELFALYSDYTRRWKAQFPLKKYWSLHPPLTTLESLFHSHSMDEKSYSAVQQEANMILVEYFLRLRDVEDILLPDCLDTLLVHLFLDLAESERLESLVKIQNHTLISEVEKKLNEYGKIHALALLKESHKEYCAAVELWVDLVKGNRVEMKADQGHFARSLDNGKSTLEVVVVEVARVLQKASSNSEAVKRFLPWLMDNSVDDSLTVLNHLAIPVEQVMHTCQSVRSEFRWRYLDYIVNEKSSMNPNYHTEYALALVDLIEGETAREGSLDGESIRPQLLAFLEGSEFYNAQGVLSRLRKTELWPEQVIINGKIGNHKESLRILTFVLKETEGAVAYCERLGTQEGYLLLLDMFLNPMEGPPLYKEAVRLLGSKGASLNPQNVLDALSPDMPLPLAYETLVRMLRERMHRKRSGQILKGIAKAHELSIAQERVLSLSEHIEINEDRACRVCHSRIGTKVFGVYPNGMLVCYRCMMKQGKDAPYVCPVTNRDFRMQ